MSITIGNVTGLTPKEKADELIESFHSVCGYKRFSVIYALIAVNEIINLFQSFSDLNSVIVMGDLSTSVIDHIETWRKVKEEIINVRKDTHYENEDES
jgi:hypothetical protein